MKTSLRTTPNQNSPSEKPNKASKTLLMRETIKTWTAQDPREEQTTNNPIKHRVVSLNYEDSPNIELIHEIADNSNTHTREFDEHKLLVLSPHSGPRMGNTTFKEGEIITLSTWVERPYGNPRKKVKHEIRIQITANNSPHYAAAVVEHCRKDPKRDPNTDSWVYDDKQIVNSSNEFTVGQPQEMPDHTRKPDQTTSTKPETLEDKMPSTLE